MVKKKEPDLDPQTLMMAYLCVKEAVSLPKKVEVLDRFGLKDSIIAKVCGVAEGSVANARLNLKRKPKGKAIKQKASLPAPETGGKS